MSEYSITNNYMEIIAGTTNIFSPAYMEAAENVEKNNAEGYGYLRNFVKSIDTLSKKEAVKDDRITATKGNVKSFQEYNDIKFAIDFLSKNVAGISTVADCKTVLSKLEEFAPLYTDGYTKQSKLVIYEYDTALYVLVTALSMVMATGVNVTSNGADIKITRKESATHGVIAKTLNDYAKQLSAKGHKEYLETMIKAMDEVGPANYHESVITEGSLDTMLAAIEVGVKGIKSVGQFGVHLAKGIKNSIFGVVPLIRSGMYLKYRKKADTIAALDQQCQFIKMNVEQLKNKKSANEQDEAKKQTIIKKQEAVIEAYKKKAEKLRAQLVETEKEVATAIQKENPQIKSNSKDDEFVLEFGKTVEEVFPEIVNESRYDESTNFSFDEFHRIGHMFGDGTFNFLTKPSEKKDAIAIINKKAPESLKKIIKDENADISKRRKAYDDLWDIIKYDKEWQDFCETEYDESANVDKALKKMASRGYKIATNENPLDAENVKKALNIANSRMKQILGAKWDESDKKKLASWMDSNTQQTNLSSNPDVADAIGAVVKFMEVAPKEKKEIMHKLYKTCGTVDEFLKRAKKEIGSISESYYDSEYEEAHSTDTYVAAGENPVAAITKMIRKSSELINDIDYKVDKFDRNLKTINIGALTSAGVPNQKLNSYQIEINVLKSFTKDALTDLKELRRNLVRLSNSFNAPEESHSNFHSDYQKIKKELSNIEGKAMLIEHDLQKRCKKLVDYPSGKIIKP